MVGFWNLRFLAGVLALLVLVAVAPHSEAVISCRQVRDAISPCFGYLGGRKSVSTLCCNSIKGLKNNAKQKVDRQSICVCLKNLAGANYGSRIGKARMLPTLCGFRLGYPISLSINCNK